MLTKEQAEEIKEQILEQIKEFPEDKRKPIEDKVLAMTNEELEEFLKQNQTTSTESQEKEQKCIFCSILENKLPSHKIAEEKNSIAILEINPISKGHSLVIPKKHAETTKIPRTAFSLAKKIAEKIKSKFKPIELKITTTTIMGHALIEIIPFYKDTNPTKRQKAEEKSLIETQQLLYFVKKEKKQRLQKKSEEQTEIKKVSLPKVSLRIP